MVFRQKVHGAVFFVVKESAPNSWVFVRRDARLSMLGAESAFGYSPKGEICKRAQGSAARLL